MTLYKVRKGNAEFYIQPDMIEIYSLAGYKIIKLEETTVKDVKAEMELIEREEGNEQLGNTRITAENN